jgi:RHS repeat-associated protein
MNLLIKTMIKTAAGQKVRKVVLHNGVTTTTDYLDGFQYKNTVLEFFGHAEGFVQNINNTLRYVYQYKDQVGNVRVSYASVNGVTTMLEENHYYPYGLKHAGYGLLPNTDNNSAFKYRYNSREYHDELGLDMTAMDFRLYDNVLGRFFGMDALSEKNHYLSTYQFGNNNPIMFADPTGLMPEWWPDWMKSMWTGSDDNTTWTNIGGGFRNNENGTIVSINAGGSGAGGGGSEPFMTFTSYTHMVNFFNAFVPNTGGAIESLRFTNKGSGNYNVSWNSVTIESLDENMIRTTTKKVKILGGGNGGGASSDNTNWWNNSNNVANGLNISMGFQSEILGYAICANYKSARNPWAFYKLLERKQIWRTNNTLLPAGKKLLIGTKALGAVGGVMTVGLTSYQVYEQGYATKRNVADIVINTAGVVAAVFFATTPIGWAVAGGALLYSVGTTIYDHYNP